MGQDGAESVSKRPGDDQLLAAYRNGDERAAQVLFDRYYTQLLSLVRRRMGRLLAEVEESSDVVQSVFQSLFKRAGQIVVCPDGSLWPLLAKIALNKIRNQVKFWRRQRRDRGREVSLEERDPLETGPTPQDAAKVEEVLHQLLEPFSPLRQKIIEHLLDGFPIGEIACRVECSERTVYKTRKAAEAVLRQLDAAS